MVNWVRFGRKQPNCVLQVPRVRLATIAFLWSILFSSLGFASENANQWGGMVVLGDGNFASDSQLGITYALPETSLTGWWTKMQWHFEGSVSSWWGHSGVGGNNHVFGVGLTPVIRVYHGEHLFTEMGFGLNDFSQTTVSAQRDVTTHYLFGDHVGVGWQDETLLSGAISVRLKHYSNAGIENPNPGINFWELVYSGTF